MEHDIESRAGGGPGPELGATAGGAPRALRPADLSFPLEPARLFGRDAPLALEIGFGSGQFLLELGRRRPGWNLIGADVSPGSVVRAYQLLRAGNARHVVLFRGHASFLVREALPPGSLASVYVNFPDPWPKARHARRRLLDAPFLRSLSTRLSAGGTVLLTTDHEPYFEASLEEARRTGLFRVELGSPPPEALETRYARKWRAHRRAIHHARLVPVGQAVDEAVPRVEIEAAAAPRPGDAMHHATLAGGLPAPETFEKTVGRFPGGVAIVLDVLRGTRGGGLTFLVRLEELDLVQEILVVAREHGEGRVRVEVCPFGQPLPTRGTREAVALVTRWLEEQGLDLVHRSF